MTVTRNQIMNALLAVLSGMSGPKVFTRRYKEINQTSLSAQMPYLILTKPREKYPPRPISALPAKRTFTCEVIIWISAGQDQESIPDSTVCDLLDELDRVLRPPVGSQTLTLGGLVDYCYIEGDIECVPGDLDGFGMIRAILSIVVP